MFELVVAFVITTIAIGYWSWVLVWSSIFVWGRDCLDALQTHCHTKEWWLHHRVIKFIRDALRCPWCSAFHLAEFAQIGFWVFAGSPLNLIPSKGWTGDVATWFALAFGGGIIGWSIGLMTGRADPYHDDTFAKHFLLRHGRLYQEGENNVG
jgi:hypothetical protein